MARLGTKKISRRTVGALKVEKDTIFWDSELAGFGVRVHPTGRKVYIAQTRADGKAAKRVTVGKHGVITAEEARRRAALIVSRIKAGEEAIPEPMAAKLAGGPTVDDVGDPGLPPWRFISGVTETSLGEMTVVGLCIPRKGSRAGTRYGGERRRPGKTTRPIGILSGAPSRRLLVMGDFNQQVGVGAGGSRSLQARRSGRAHRAALLRKALPPQITLATAALGYRGRRTIDHVVLSADMTVEALSVISNIHEGRRLSDHFGIAAELGMHATRQSASPGSLA